MKVILHYAVSQKVYGETRIRTLCNRSRLNVVNIDTIEKGQNITFDPNLVTCSFCKRILPRRLELEQKGEPK
jgi:hypothetical protein